MATDPAWRHSTPTWDPIVLWRPKSGPCYQTVSRATTSRYLSFRFGPASSSNRSHVYLVQTTATKPATHCFQLSLILPCTEHHTPACKTCPSPFTSSQRMRMAGSMSGYESLLLVNPSANVKAPFEGLWKFFTDAVVEQVARDEGWEGRRIAEGMLDRK